jgi:2-polyprenyl-3-methyl-5-hydroxy-6-metoxy-1,4-benzoquinol methylase
VDSQAHWSNIYATRSPEEVSWFEPLPTVSLQRVTRAIEGGARSVIDVGGGASRLVDQLIGLNLDRIAVLDVVERGLEVAKERLGSRSEQVEWIVADITKAEDVGRFDVWHDRAVFHFLTDPADRAHYVALCERTVPPGGVAVVATFSPEGPEMCSGLPVHRYGASELSKECGPAFALIDSERYLHRTPSGGQQSFLYSSLRRVAGDRQRVEA